MSGNLINTWLSAGMLLLSTGAMSTMAGDWSNLFYGQMAYGRVTDELQQQEWLLNTEYNGELWGGDITGISRVRWDTVKDLNQQGSSRPDSYSAIGGPLAVTENGEIDLRELYWELSTESLYWRIGKQQVVWGEADGLKLLDVINPQSFREFVLDDFDDSRIPLWMLNVEYTLNNNSALQLLWIPDTSTHELAPENSPFVFTSPLLVPRVPSGVPVEFNSAKAPNNLIDDSDIGLRLTSFTRGWDISLNYLYRFVDTPVVTSRLDNGVVVANADYRRSHLTGGSASTAFGDWTLRTEVAYESNRFQRTRLDFPGVSKSDQWSSVIGLDWQGWTDQFVSLQWFQTTILGGGEELVANRQEDTLTLLWELNFFNETLTLEWLHIHSIDHGDGVIQPQLTYNYRSNIDVYLGVDWFYGDEDELYGQFDRADRITIGFIWGL